MAEGEPLFSAIVVTYFTGPILDTCLDALLKDPLCGEVVVVNNGNPRDVVDQLIERRLHEPKLKLVDGHGNIGFGLGCNIGVSEALQACVVFVNPDCVIDSHTLTEFACVLPQYPGALVGGSLRNQDGSEQRGCRRGQLTLWSAFVSFAGLGRPGEAAGIWRDFNRLAEPMPTHVVDMPVVSGALMAMETAAFKDQEGFSPFYFLHMEDIDLCDRVRNDGRRVLFAPNATAMHLGATSNVSPWLVERAKIMSMNHYFSTNARSFWERAATAVVMPILALVIVGRMLLRHMMRRKN